MTTPSGATLADPPTVPSSNATSAVPSTATPSTSAAPSTGDPTGSPTSAAGRRLTAFDDGSTFSLEVDQTAELALVEDAPEPTVEGDAVIVIRTTEFSGDGDPVYEIRAVEPGTATVIGDDFRIGLIVT